MSQLPTESRPIGLTNRFLLVVVVCLVGSAMLEAQTPAGSPSPTPVSIEAEPESGSDQIIQERLQGIFSSIPDRESIEVSVSNGVVHLKGDVPSKEVADQSVALAKRINGVVHVRNDMDAAKAVQKRVSPALVKLRELGRQTMEWLPVALVAFGVLIGCWLLGKWLTLRSEPFRLLGLSELSGALARRIIRLLMAGIGLLIALEIMDATALAGALVGIAGVTGIAFGFAFRNIVENYLAGVLLSTRHPFRVGDYVCIGEFEGKIVRLTSSDTVLMTLDGNHLRIPNSLVINREMLNYSLNPLRRFQFAVGVSVDLDLAHARRVALETMRDLGCVLEDPAPMVIVEALGDSTVNMRVFGWIDQRTHDFLKARSEAIRHVKAAFDEHGIEMPEPIYRVHTKELTAGAESASKQMESASEVIDAGTDPTIDRQVAEELATSKEPNLLPPDERSDDKD